jgi:hypothetical protein
MKNLTEIKRVSGDMNVPLSVGYGKSFAHGTKILGPATTIDTGLSSVDAFFAEGEVANDDMASVVVKVKWSATLGVVTVTGLKHAGASTAGLVASTASATISWMAFGDK